MRPDYYLTSLNLLGQVRPYFPLRTLPPRELEIILLWREEFFLFNKIEVIINWPTKERRKAMKTRQFFSPKKATVHVI